MVHFSAREDLAARFASHIDLFEQHFGDCGIPFGTPAGIQAVVERLRASVRFHDDMTSLMKAIIYSESETLTRMELLDVLYVAAGGDAMEASDQPVTSAMRELLVFVNEVLLSLHRPWFAESQETGDWSSLSLVTDSVPAPQVEAEQVSELLVEPGQALVPWAAGKSASLYTNGQRSPSVADVGQQSGNKGSEIEVREAAAEGTPLSAVTSDDRGLEPRRERSTPPEAVSTPRKGMHLRQAVLLLGAVVTGFCLGIVVEHRPVPLVAFLAGKNPRGHEKANSPEQAKVPGEGPQPVQPIPPSALQEAAAAAGQELSLQPDSQPVLDVPFALAQSHLSYSPQPIYPTLAKLTAVEREVTVRTVVSPRGVVIETTALQGRAPLRQAAEMAVRQWRFQPYLSDRKPVEIRTVIPVDVRLEP